MTSPLLVAGDVLAGKYRVGPPRARRDAAEIFEGEAPDGAAVAVAALALGDGDPARFARDAAALRGVVSPHLARLLDAGVEGEVAWAVAPFPAGERFAAAVERLRPLHHEAVTRILLQASEGLDALHRAGIVHRGISPDALRLVPEGDGLRAVLDLPALGARDDAPPRPDLGVTYPASLWCAPERATSAPVDARADVYALAMVGYYGLTGVPPLAHCGTFEEALEALRAGELPSLQTVASWVPAGVTRVIHGALLRATEDRCPSASELTLALRGLLVGAERLTRADLRAVAPRDRACVADRASLPRGWSEVRAALTRTRARESPATPEAPEEAPSAQPGDLVADRYRVVRLLGRGGMGEVYEATAPDGARVAVKVIRGDPASLDPELVRRFVREGRAVRSITNPHVVKVLDAGGGDRARPSLARELMSGVDLATLVEREGPLEPGAAARVCVQACEGIAAAHRRGIVHRDVKPSNLFLHVEGDVVTVKVCDFGIAKDAQHGGATSTDLTATGGFLGSPQYMSPEQIRDSKSVDARADVWSLGVALYQSLTGRLPWGDGPSTVAELILKICAGEPAPLADVAPWVDARLAAVVARAMSKERAQRHADAAALAAELAPFARAGSLTLGALTEGASSRREAARTSRPAAVSSVSGASGWLASNTPASGKGGRARATVAAVAALGLAVAATFAFRLARAPAPAEPSRPAPAYTAAPAPPAVNAVPELVARTATLEVAPPDATVTVDGAEVPVRDGRVLVRGLPGTRFAIAVRAGAASSVATVVLAADGTLVPPRVAAPPRPTPAPRAPRTAPSPARSAAPSASSHLEAPALREDWK